MVKRSTISICVSFVVCLTFVAALLAAQTPANNLAFEVASIKPAEQLDPQKIMQGKMRIGMKIDKAQVDIASMTLSDLIRIAFRVKDYQVVAPAWLTAGGPMNTQRWDIRAKMPDDAKEDQVPEMLQALLKERFKLTFHRDNVEHKVYALIVDKNGPKMKEAPPEETPKDGKDGGGTAPSGPSNGPSSTSSPAAPPPPPPPSGMIGPGGNVRFSAGPEGGGSMRIQGGGAGNMRMNMSGGVMHMENDRMTMEMLTQMLTRFVDRPIVDMTGLKGQYQVAIDLSMEDMMNAAKMMGAGGGGAGPVVVMRGGGDASMGGPGGGAKNPADTASDPTTAGTSIYHSLSQLGLKLDPRKAPVDRIVIDTLEKTPTEN